LCRLKIPDDSAFHLAFSQAIFSVNPQDFLALLTGTKFTINSSGQQTHPSCAAGDDDLAILTHKTSSSTSKK